VVQGSWIRFMAFNLTNFRVLGSSGVGVRVYIGLRAVCRLRQ
jgi:hypothetical protein